MGTTVRLLADAPARAAPRRASSALAARLTRFDPASELCALNADPRAEVPASPLLRRAVAAALLGARRTGGLVDPTLLVRARGRRLRAVAGSASSPPRSRPPCAPRPLAARPHPAPRWREVDVDDEAARSSGRPGSASTSAAAPRASRPTGPRSQLARHRFAVDCGGDVRVGGDRTTSPSRGTAPRRCGSRDAAIATSGIDRRVWQRPDGSLRPPPARPRHRRAGLDRPDRRHRARPDGARGRGAGEGRAPVRPASARGRCCAAGGGIVDGRRRPRRGRRRNWRWPHDARPDGLRLVAGQPRARASSRWRWSRSRSASGWRWPARRSGRPGCRAS